MWDFDGTVYTDVSEWRVFEDTRVVPDELKKKG